MRTVLRRRLLARRDPETGVWTGELASSALATALAAAALAEGGESADREQAQRGAAWLATHANRDGGWGDTPESPSNLSATLMVTATLRQLAPAARALQAADDWIREHVGGEATPANISRALRDVYGQDRTFAVPILAFLAMCDRRTEAWRETPPLPFLLALLPRGLYRLLRLQVVSYALPALIAVGMCRQICLARARGGWAWARLFAAPLLWRLERLQPSHGGFLDAIPLTAFVALSLRQAGYGGHLVARRGLAFLRQAERADGSWAIDSNLRVWVTTLAARAVTEACGRERGGGGQDIWLGELEQIAAWLARTQTQTRHPFTGAAPGGWAWTDLPGGVPDADDTSGALVALRRLSDAGCRTDVSRAARKGVRWLLALQNRDGGMPTFCRGWGRLPFDRSCPDISAHALSALSAWADLSLAIPPALARLTGYLARAQDADGSWTPLWFGHPDAPGGRNPIVGTARVVAAMRELKDIGQLPDSGEAPFQRGAAWLAARQREDGAWGMGREPTLEETAWAVRALAGSALPEEADAARRGATWLVAQERAGQRQPAPIGLYFALLWYHEQLYPLIWSLEALNRLIETSEVSGEQQ